MKTAAQMSAAWGSAMADARTAQKYRDSINAVTVNPMALAATDEAQQRYLQRIQLSVSSGRRAAALNAASPATWKSNAVNIGANALATGARKGQPKMDAHMQKWQPIYAQAQQAAHAIPKSNWLGRVQAAVEVMMKAAGTA